MTKKRCDFRIEDIKSRKSSSILMNIRKMLLFSKSFQYPYRFQYQSKIIRVIQIKKKHMYKFFVYSCNIFPFIDQMSTLTLYINCYVILTTYYMLHSALEPSYDLLKNLLLLPWILKLILDMVNDSTPL